MGKKDDFQEMNGGVLCLSLILITAVGAIAGGTLLLTIATNIDGRDAKPAVVTFGSAGPYHGQEGSYSRQRQLANYEGVYLNDGRYDDKIWTIATNYYDAVNNYLDKDSGQIIGFNIDVIHEVCLIAGKHCELIRDNYRNAWNGTFGGRGLLGGWYDCFQGYFSTYPRIRAFQFTEPFTKTEPGWFGVAPGNPRNVDWTDLRNRKVGFLRGWFADARCLERSYQEQINGVPLEEESIFFYNNSTDIIEAVLNGEADVVFVSTELDTIRNTLQQVGPLLDRCTIGGSSLMCRKDSHLPSWWNPAWKTLLNSQIHKEFCDRVDNIYNLFDRTSAEICLTR